MTELDDLLFEKECPFHEKCDLRCRLEDERGKRIVLETRVEQYKNDFALVLQQIVESFALKHYVERLAGIPELEFIYLIRKEDILDVWTIISESNLEVEEKIANVQCELLRIYENLDFDFMIFPRFESNIDEFLPNDAEKIFPVGG